MSYSFSLDDVAFLRSRHGEKALQTVSGLELSPSSMLADIAETRSRYAPHDAALIETVRCRRRARAKLRDPEDLLLADVALQQATASAVAAHRAAEIATRFSGAAVHDMTCSIGAEVRELLCVNGISGVIGSDLDGVRLAMARHNAPDATLLRADALTPTSTADVLLADPARRSDAGRIFRLDQLNPPLLELLTTYAGRTLIVKCAPGLDHQMPRNRFGFEGEVQVISLDSGVREATLWSGPGVLPCRRATVLRTGIDGTVTQTEITDHSDDDVPAGEAGEWIVDPDGAIVRAGLVRHYAYQHGLWQLDPQIAYLTGDSVPDGARGFRVVEQTGVTEKVLRKSLSALDCGPLEILVRGLDIDPDRLRKKLKPKGSRPLSLVLTRIGRKGVAFICEPGVRP